MNTYTVQVPLGTGRGKPLTWAFLLALAVHTLLIAGVDFTVLSSASRTPVLSLNITLMEKPGGNPAPASEPAAVAAQPRPALPSPEPPVNTSEPAASARLSVPVSRPAPLPRKAPPAPPASPAAGPGVPARPAPLPRKAPPAPIPAKQSPPVRKAASPARPIGEKPRPPVVSASELRRQGLQMARMEIAPRVKRGDARKKYLDPNAMTTLESFYLNSWQEKVETVGTLNFPEEARRLKVVTGPVLDVALRADGTVQAIRLVRSSGHNSLDRAARRIVELAAPFAPFPKELQRHYDVLHIVRKWKFEQGRLSGR